MLCRTLFEALYVHVYFHCVFHGDFTETLYCKNCCHPCYVVLTVSATQNGWTPLVAAALMGHLDVVKELLKNGANPDIQGPVSG